jgi:ubiquitin C-terminal hydrolase
VQPDLLNNVVGNLSRLSLQNKEEEKEFQDMWRCPKCKKVQELADKCPCNFTID